MQTLVLIDENYVRPRGRRSDGYVRTHLSGVGLICSQGFCTWQRQLSAAIGAQRDKLIRVLHALESKMSDCAVTRDGIPEQNRRLPSLTKYVVAVVLFVILVGIGMVTGRRRHKL